MATHHRDYLGQSSNRRSWTRGSFFGMKELIAVTFCRTRVAMHHISWMLVVWLKDQFHPVVTHDLFVKKEICWEGL